MPGALKSRQMAKPYVGKNLGNKKSTENISNAFININLRKA